MSEDRGTDDVADHFVRFPIPGKEHRTRTAAPINFEQLMRFVGCEVDFILINARWPQQANDIGASLLPESSDDLRRPLREISAAARKFPLLLRLARENRDFCSEGTLVVVKAFEVDAERVVLVSAITAQRNQRSVSLGDQ